MKSLFDEVKVSETSSRDGHNHNNHRRRRAPPPTDSMRHVLTREWSSVSEPSDWLKSSALRGRLSSSSSCWYGPLPQGGEDGEPAHLGIHHAIQAVGERGEQGGILLFYLEGVKHKESGGETPSHHKGRSYKSSLNFLKFNFKIKSEI